MQPEIINVSNSFLFSENCFDMMYDFAFSMHNDDCYRSLIDQNEVCHEWVIGSKIAYNRMKAI